MQSRPKRFRTNSASSTGPRRRQRGSGLTRREPHIPSVPATLIGCAYPAPSDSTQRGSADKALPLRSQTVVVLLMSSRGHGPFLYDTYLPSEYAAEKWPVRFSVAAKGASSSAPHTATLSMLARFPRSAPGPESTTLV